MAKGSGVVNRGSEFALIGLDVILIWLDTDGRDYGENLMEQHTLISSNAEGNEIITPVCDNHTTEQPIDLKTKQLPLPLALQEVELTDSDVALLLEIANDPNYPTGRYKGKPKEIPLRENNS